MRRAPCGHGDAGAQRTKTQIGLRRGVLKPWSCGGRARRGRGGGGARARLGQACRGPQLGEVVVVRRVEAVDLKGRYDRDEGRGAQLARVALVARGCRPAAARHRTGRPAPGAAAAASRGVILGEGQVAAQVREGEAGDLRAWHGLLIPGLVLDRRKRELDDVAPAVAPAGLAGAGVTARVGHGHLCLHRAHGAQPLARTPLFLCGPQVEHGAVLRCLQHLDAGTVSGGERRLVGWGARLWRMRFLARRVKAAVAGRGGREGAIGSWHLARSRRVCWWRRPRP